jgi:hypothetical protein
VSAARAFDLAVRRKMLHLQIIKGFCLIDQNFELLPLPCFSTQAHGFSRPHRGAAIFVGGYFSFVSRRRAINA